MRVLLGDNDDLDSDVLEAVATYNKEQLTVASIEGVEHPVGSGGFPLHRTVSDMCCYRLLFRTLTRWRTAGSWTQRHGLLSPGITYTTPCRTSSGLPIRKKIARGAFLTIMSSLWNFDALCVGRDNLEGAMRSYVEDHYSNGALAVYPTEDEFVIAIVDSKYNPTNYW